MPVAPEGEWTVEVRLRSTTYGTEAQARATAERWHQLVQVAAQRDLELVDVVVHQPGDPDCETCEGRGLVGLVAPLDPCPDCVATVPPDEPLGAWVGTVAYEGVETTDGRVLQRLSWPRLVLGPLPVVELGTGRQVGTVTEAWREALGPHGGPSLEEGTPVTVVEGVPQGAVRIRARGTLQRSAAGPDGHVALGVDVTGGQVESDGDHVVLVDGKLLGLTLYPEGSGSTPAWPDAALQLEEVRGAEHPASE